MKTRYRYQEYFQRAKAHEYFRHFDKGTSQFDDEMRSQRLIGSANYVMFLQTIRVDLQRIDQIYKNLVLQSKLPVRNGDTPLQVVTEELARVGLVETTQHVSEEQPVIAADDKATVTRQLSTTLLRVDSGRSDDFQDVALKSPSYVLTDVVGEESVDQAEQSTGCGRIFDCLPKLGWRR